MPTGSEKWPKAALGQDEVEKLAKTRSNRCVQVGWEWRRSEVGAWRTEDRGQRPLVRRTAKLSQRI